jgi:hypothetical protein
VSIALLTTSSAMKRVKRYMVMVGQYIKSNTILLTVFSN